MASSAYYTLKRDGGNIRDTCRQAHRRRRGAARLDGAALADIDGAAAGARRRNAQRMAFVRNGDVFVRDLRSGALTQLTRSNDERVAPAVEQRRRRWSGASATTGIAGPRPAAWRRPRCSRPRTIPRPSPKADDLRDRQLRTARHPARRQGAPRRAARAGRSMAQGRPQPRAGAGLPGQGRRDRRQRAVARRALAAGGHRRPRAPTPARPASCRST